MPLDAEEFVKLLIKITTLENQINRLLSDAESEKDTRKRRNDYFDGQIKEIRQQISEVKKEAYKHLDELVAWKNNVTGSLQTLKVFAGIVGSIIVGVAIWFFTKN